MNIGIFTDTYYPQVSGVATSIKTLREQLEKQGHTAYIFTTTDPNVDKSIYERNIFRFSSIPFISFTDRRIAVRGLFHAYQVAKELNLDPSSISKVCKGKLKQTHGYKFRYAVVNNKE